MSTLSENIRYLRNQKKLTQQKVADDLTISRPRYAKYEEGVSEPPLVVLKKLSGYFHVSVDLLISRDLSKVDFDGLLKLEDNRLVLPMKVNSKGENLIEIIPHKAKAGYLNSYSDPEFIESLQHISLPFLKDGKYRAFPVEGDSMPPHKEGSYIVAKYVEHLRDVKDGKTYILLTRNDGIVYKRVHIKNQSILALISDNPFYMPYELNASDLLEIWEHACSIATIEFEPDDLRPQTIKEMFSVIKNDLNEIKARK